ncbi:MAG TPA: DUF3467 domain-containing protein [Thermoanaerobaculia bacterium]|mgnify:CR=1 FL=1|nr:DUF3467 domain-containing protein [Thermoanaerobaculia bacterium]HUM30483.1 DUF3467 domain-containing protein [Thermoanaerobaculia bacterium]HXK68650.1 DUF3467 domain-containing protein [Thermoanaerobaculia bacterium]
MDETKQVQLKVIVGDDVDQGIYVNFANIFHNPTEFVLDLGRVVPGKPEVKIHARLITTPFHAKRILETLKMNIAQYEQSFGPIRTEYGGPSDKGEKPS